MIAFSMLSSAAAGFVGWWTTQRATEQEHQHKMEELRALREDQRAVRFSQVRTAEVAWPIRLGRLLVIFSLMGIYVFAAIAPAFCDVTITYLYYEQAQGFWPWSVPHDQLASFTIGTGANAVVLIPELLIAINTITSFLFGHLAAKR